MTKRDKQAAEYAAETASKKSSKQTAQETHMLVQYGRQSERASVRVYMTPTEITKFFGERCPSHEPFCALCEVWAEWQKTGKVTFDISRNDALRILENMSD